MPMSPQIKLFLVIGSLFLAFAVAFGAFGAHALRQQVPEQSIATWQTGVLYQFMHGFGLLIIGVLLLRFPELTGLKVAGVLFIIGILFFSGSLYGLVLANWRWLGPITPLGGLCFIAGWVSMAWSLFRLPA